jgi:hypothetical protein
MKIAQVFDPERGGFCQRQKKISKENFLRQPTKRQTLKF